MAAHGLAQSPSRTPAFVSVGLGPFWTDRSGFAETYGSRAVLAGAVGFGLPVARHLHLYGKVMYMAEKSLDETAQFKQWLVNAGLQYGLPLLDDIILAFQGGVAYSVVSEETHNADGLSSSLHGSGIQGLFGGVGAERTFDRSPWSVFAEIQYNTTRSDIASLVGEFGGLNIMLGIRYRFLRDQDSKEDSGPPPSIWEK